MTRRDCRKVCDKIGVAEGDSSLNARRHGHSVILHHQVVWKMKLPIRVEHSVEFMRELSHAAQASLNREWESGRFIVVALNVTSSLLVSSLSTSRQA